jgi:hypothetical protein
MHSQGLFAPVAHARQTVAHCPALTPKARANVCGALSGCPLSVVLPRAPSLAHLAFSLPRSVYHRAATLERGLVAHIQRKQKARLKAWERKIAEHVRREQPLAITLDLTRGMGARLDSLKRWERRQSALPPSTKQAHCAVYVCPPGLPCPHSLHHLCPLVTKASQVMPRTEAELILSPRPGQSARIASGACVGCDSDGICRRSQGL